MPRLRQAVFVSTLFASCLTFAWIRSFLLKNMPFAITSSASATTASTGSSVDAATNGVKQGHGAVLGGGPSSNAPLLLLEEMRNVRFFGDPSESYIFTGRDPQKTWLTLLDVALQYKTYANLKKATRLYYRYIHFVADFFRIDLSLGVEKCYNIAYSQVPTGLQDTIILYCKETDQFLPAKLETSGNVFLINSGGSPVQSEILVPNLNRIQLQRIVGMENVDVVPCEAMDLEVKLESDISLVAPTREKAVNIAAGSYQFLYAPKLHASLHYLSTFSNAWEDVDKFNQDDYDFVINRAGFEYPDHSGTKTMKGLNYNYANFIASVLSKVKSTLNELQLRLLSICLEYRKSSKEAWEELKKEDCYVVVGAGRAAGEIARRLHDDFVHRTKGTDGSILAANAVVDQASFAQEETDLREELGKGQKSVAIIDHHGISFDDDGALKKLISKTSYRDFLLEVVKSKKVPMFASATDKKFYTVLHSKLKELPDESKSATMEGIEESLRLLLTKPRDNSSYMLQVEFSRDPKRWKNDPGTLLSSNGETCQSVKLVQIGGSQQKGPQEMKKYSLTRIHDSHYRKENMEFLEAVANGAQDMKGLHSAAARYDLLAALAKSSNAGWSRPSSL